MTAQRANGRNSTIKKTQFNPNQIYRGKSGKNHITLTYGDYSEMPTNPFVLASMGTSAYRFQIARRLVSLAKAGHTKIRIDIPWNMLRVCYDDNLKAIVHDILSGIQLVSKKDRTALNIHLVTPKPPACFVEGIAGLGCPKWDTEAHKELVKGLHSFGFVEHGEKTMRKTEKRPASKQHQPLQNSGSHCRKG